MAPRGGWHAAGVSRGKYRTNTNKKLAKLVQRLAREESARRSTGGRNGIVWCHVKGHAGHPGNEWADVLADLGADCVFDAGGGGDVAYPFAQDDYEESDAADTRNATLPHLERLISTQMRPDGETRFRVP